MCPPSEFSMRAILPTAAPTQAPTMSGASIHMPGVVMGVSVVAAALAASVL
jgi:hypothetical protein